MRPIFGIFVVALAASAPAPAAEPVPVQPFRQIELRAGGDVTIRPGPVQRVTILRGSSQVTTFRAEREGRLMITACKRNCPYNYDLRIDIQTPVLPAIAIFGGGTVTVADGFGAQSHIAAAISGGGEIDLRSVRSEAVSAAINGGGTIRTGRSDTLVAAINGGGEIRYSGNPAVTSAVRGGGDVDRDY